jgi:hypothetical protein
MRVFRADARLRSVRTICVFVSGAMLGSNLVIGADLGPAASPSVPLAPVPVSAPWSVQVTPYGWLPFLNGDIIVRARTATIDITPVEVLRHLTDRGAHLPVWMSYIEARRGPLSFYNDIFYANLGLSGSDVRTPRGRADIGVSLGLEYEQAIVEVGGAYEVARWVSGGSLKDPTIFAGTTALDVFAGARYWHQQMNLQLAVSAQLDLSDLVVQGNRAIARSGNVDWVDPLVGLRLRHQLAPGQEIVVRGDVGGFDVGSKFSWQAIAAYTYEFAVRDGITYTSSLGYRALDVDFEKGSGRRRYEYDVLQHGPLLGLTVGF